MPDTQSDDAPWAAQLGPALTEQAVARLLRRSVADVNAMQGLLRLTNRDGQRVYPAFQFHQGAPLPGLAEVVTGFAPVVATPLTTAAWLTQPNTDLDDRRPVDVLLVGDMDRVTRLSRRVAAGMRG